MSSTSYPDKRAVVRIFLLPIVLSVVFVSCGSKPSNRPPVHQYHLTGKVVALDAKDQTATIDQAAIPGWMNAMTMEYPVKLKSEFNTLHVGDKIEGTVNQHGDGEYDLSNIHKQAPAK